MKRAHAHLISVIAAELSARDFGPDEPVRLLDVGCGYGGLMRDLIRELPKLGFAYERIQIYGYEILEQRARFPGYVSLLREALARARPETDWEERVRVGSARTAWPFESGMFHGAFSNQVVEHVECLDLFFSELKRVVAPGGFATHLYPSKEVFVEPHSGVPFAHWMHADLVEKWIRYCSRVGFGKYHRYRRERATCLSGFCSEFAGYLEKYVYFRRNGEIRRLARRCSAESGFKYAMPLVSRALQDDWELFRYAYSPSYRRFSPLSPFTSSTLVQRF